MLSRIPDTRPFREKKEKIADIKRNIRDSMLVSSNVFPTGNICSFELQAILKAMSEIVPPVQLEKPENEAHVKYLREVSTAPEFEYPDVRPRIRRVIQLSQRFTIFSGVLRSH